MLKRGQRQAGAEEGALPSPALGSLPWHSLPVTRGPGVEQGALAAPALPTPLWTLTHQHAEG